MSVSNELVAATHGVVQCEVTVVREGAGWHRSFVLRVGNILRIGRGPGNDIVLDFDGVSSYHAELFLRSSGASHGLCVRDNSKNGTGIRPGPNAPDSLSWANGIEPVWETLRRGAFRSIDHGWQLVVPMKNGRGADQPPEQAHIMTLYVGERVCAAEAADLDGEAWEPDSGFGDQQADVGHTQSAPPPPPDLGGLAFEEPPGPPVQSLQAPRTVQASTGADAAPAHRPGAAAAGVSSALAEQQAVKDHFLARDEWIGHPPLRQQGNDTRDEEIWERLELDTSTQVPLDHSGGVGLGQEARDKSHDTGKPSEPSQSRNRPAKKPTPSSSSEDSSSAHHKRSRKKRKRKQTERQPKKKKKAQKAKTSKKAAQVKRKKDTQKQERKQKVIRKRKKQEDSDETDLEMWIRKKAEKRLALQKARKKKQNSRPCDTSTSQSDEVECQQRARQLQTQPPNGESSQWDRFNHESSACQSEGGHAAGHPQSGQQVHTDENMVAAKEPQAIIALEITESEVGDGFFLLCGIHSEQPMFRRIRDGEPSFLFFNNCNANGLVGWHVGSCPGRTIGPDPEEFWHSDSGTLPAISRGARGGRMQAHKTLDHSLLTALGSVDNRLCCEIRTAFSIAVGGGGGPGETGVDQEVGEGSSGGREGKGEAPGKAGSMDASKKEQSWDAQNGDVLQKEHEATPAVQLPSLPDNVVNNEDQICPTGRSHDSEGSGRTVVPDDLCEDGGETQAK